MLNGFSNGTYKLLPVSKENNWFCIFLKKNIFQDHCAYRIYCSVQLDLLKYMEQENIF